MTLLTEATDRIQAIRKEGQVERALANASLYLEAFGHMVVGWLWLRQGLVASSALDNGGPQPQAFYQGKLRACDFFSRYELPRVHGLAQLLGEVDASNMTWVYSQRKLQMMNLA